MSPAPRAGAGRLQPRGTVELGDYPVDLAWSGDARALLVGLGDGSLVWVPSEQPGALRRLPGHKGGVLAVGWQRAGRLAASSGQDGAVLLWDMGSFQSTRIRQARQWSEHLAFAPDGRWLAVASGRSLSLFDGQGECGYDHATAPGTIAALAWRPRGRELATAGNGGVQIHQPPAQGRAPAEGAVRDYPVRGACLSVAFSPDGRWLAAGLQEGSVQLWNLAAGTQAQMTGYGSRVWATDWSASGRYLATAAGNTVAVWDCAGRGPEGTRPLALQGHAERITAMAFRPGGSWLVSAARDRRVLWWRVGAGEAPQDAHLLGEACSALRFAADGTRLAVVDVSGRLTIYDCQP